MLSYNNNEKLIEIPFNLPFVKWFVSDFQTGVITEMIVNKTLVGFQRPRHDGRRHCQSGDADVEWAQRRYASGHYFYIYKNWFIDYSGRSRT